MVGQAPGDATAAGIKSARVVVDAIRHSRQYRGASGCDYASCYPTYGSPADMLQISTVASVAYEWNEK